MTVPDNRANFCHLLDTNFSIFDKENRQKFGHDDEAIGFVRVNLHLHDLAMTNLYIPCPFA